MAVFKSIVVVFKIIVVVLNLPPFDLWTRVCDSFDDIEIEVFDTPHFQDWRTYLGNIYESQNIATDGSKIILRNCKYFNFGATHKQRYIHLQEILVEKVMIYIRYDFMKIFLMSMMSFALKSMYDFLSSVVATGSPHVLSAVALSSSRRTVIKI